MAKQWDLNDSDLNTLTWTLLGEAAGEEEIGQAAVIHTILNRTERYDKTPIQIATGGSARFKTYSTWNQEKDGGNSPVKRYPVGSREFERAKSVVNRVLAGEIPDPTGGATHYWSPGGMKNRADPYWAPDETTQYGRHQIGNHIFLPRSGVPGPIPPGEIPNVVASELDVADMNRMVPMPTSAAERDLARQTRTNVGPGTIDVGGGDATQVADTFQMDRAVPLPRPRPQDPPQLAAIPESVVRIGKLLPLIDPPTEPQVATRDVPMPRLDPRQANRMDIAAGPAIPGQSQIERNPQDSIQAGVFNLLPPAPANPRNREDTGQNRAAISTTLTPPPRMSQPQLTDEEVQTALRQQSPANPEIFNPENVLKQIPQSQIERVVMKDAGAHNVPVVGGMTMNDLNQLGKLAPKVTDLENITAEQTKIRQQEAQAAAAGQQILDKQNTVSLPTPSDQRPKTGMEALGEAIMGGIQSLFTGLTGESEDKEGLNPIQSFQKDVKGATDFFDGKSNEERRSYTGNKGNLNGKEVSEFTSERYNPDTNTFEEYTGWK